MVNIKLFLYQPIQKIPQNTFEMCGPVLNAPEHVCYFFVHAAKCCQGYILPVTPGPTPQVASSVAHMYVRTSTVFFRVSAHGRLQFSGENRGVGAYAS